MNAQTKHLEYCINNYYDWYLKANELVREAVDVEHTANQLQEYIEQATESLNLDGFWTEVLVYGFLQHVQWDKLAEALLEE